MLSYHLHHFVLHQQGTEVSRSCLQSTSHRISTEETRNIYHFTWDRLQELCNVLMGNIEACDPQLRGQIFPQRFCFVCSSYPVSTSRLGTAGREGYDTLICPVFPPNHILRSGKLADILGTSSSVIMKCKRTPKNLETACFCYSHRLGNKSPPHDAWGKRQQRGKLRTGCLACSLSYCLLPEGQGLPKSHTHKILQGLPKTRY